MEFESFEGYELIKADKEPQNILRKKRELLGLTQKQVADRANVKIVQYQRFEMGMRNIMSASFQIACRIIEALEMDITTFFHENNM
ncbi:helix-turn-helix transcriptional regulator [bacterium]|nr:helix-turn-helix transcriptional regulator [bacterium]